MSEAPVLVMLGALLLASGFFSASETALFSLREEALDRAGPVVRRLLERPQDLLVSVLFANLLVNVLFFAFSARLDARFGAFATGVGALLAILICGEILPKALALRATSQVARVAAVPMVVVVAVLLPVRQVVRVILHLVLSALGEAARDERRITPELLEAALERSAEVGLIEVGEAALVGEVLELERIRVREIMTPRVDMLALDLEEEDHEEKVRLALEKRLDWLPVVRGNPDEIAGQVRLRDLLSDASRSVEQLVMPVKFVPEVASCRTLLDALRRDRTAEAVVVDEWGGTAGTVTLEDVLEEVVGELRVEGEGREQLVVPLGEGRFRVSGSLSVRDWNEVFDLEVVPREFETVGGMVAFQLGRIPRAGDRVRVENLVCEVHEMRGRRLIDVDMFLSDGPDEEGAAA